MYKLSAVLDIELIFELNFLFSWVFFMLPWTSKYKCENVTKYESDKFFTVFT